MYPETYAYNHSNLKRLDSETLRKMLYSTTLRNQFKQIITTELTRRLPVHGTVPSPQKQLLNNIFFELEQADMPILGIQL